MSIWNIFVKSHDGKTITIAEAEKKFSIMTVLEFKSHVKERLRIPPDEQRLIFAGKQLEDEKELSYYKGLKNRATLFLVLRLPGGADRPNEALPKSLEDCMIHFDKDESLEMPCGHSICSPCLMNYVWSELGGNKSEFLCPLRQSEWTIDVIERYGNASSEEMELIQESLSENAIRNDSSVSECPGCHNYIERIDEDKNRVRCRICAKAGRTPEFCWHCFEKWNNPKSDTECGNADCNVGTFLTILREAPKKTMMGISNLQVPSKRACPGCGIVIEHTKACKHMSCSSCKVSFCFICLRKKSDGSSMCGDYNTKCSLAPVQKIIPKANKKK